MISNYNLTCDYHNFELKDKIYLIPQWALKIIYTDGFNEVVFSGNSANVTILEGYDINFQEETSFDERFRFSKTLSIKVEGYVTFNDLDNRYMAIIETKEGEFYLVNSDFPSYVTHTYTLNNGTNSTELVFSSQSNIATLKLTNFNPNNVNSCKQYSNAKIKNVKLTEAWASYLSTWQKSLVNKGEFVDIEPLPDSVSLTEEFDGEKYTVTLGFDIPMSYYKNDWHIKLLNFEDNKYRGYVTLEDGYKAFVGYNVGLFPSYTINGDIISIRLTETAIRGIAYGNEYGIVDTDIPNTISFNGATCHSYNWNSSCDWNVEDKPDYITITPTSGQADTDYVLTICNTDDTTAYAVSEFTIKTCNARIKPTVEISNRIYRWVDTNETMCVIEPIERTVSGDPYCNNCDKYIDVFDEISYDDGETWQVTSSTSTLIEADSEYCKEYRTRQSGDTYCDKCNEYVTMVTEYRCGDGEWQYSSSSKTLIVDESVNCAKAILTLNDGTDKIICYCEENASLDGISAYSATVVSAEIKDCVTSIGNYAFYNCSSLTSVTIPDSVTDIQQSAFRKCSSLTSIDIPSGVTSIGGGAFNNCVSLSSVTIPNSVTTIGRAAFYECSGLTSCTIGNGVTNVGDSAFQGCIRLTNIVIPDSVTDIQQSAFYECSGLTSVTIGNNVVTIGGHAFNGCTSLTSIAIPNSVTSIGYGVFARCSGLTSAIIGSSVTTIGNGAFRNCSGLTSVTLSNSLTTFDKDVFYNCYSLTSVTIPNSVTSIGDYTFANCSGLTSVTVNATTPPTLGYYVFDDTNNCPIYVPSGSVNAYKSATNWRTYASRIQAIP